MKKTDGEMYESPRTKRVREIVLSAGLSLMAKEGGDAVTALRISEETGVARSTIYRHWQTQSSLLLDVVDRAVTSHHQTVTTGDLEHDLLVSCQNLRTRLTARPFSEIFATILAKSVRDPDFLGPQQRSVRGVMTPVRTILEDAVERSVLPKDLDLDIACDQLVGPILVRHVMLGLAIPDTLIAETVRSFVVANTEV